MDRHAGELHRLAMTRVFCHCEELATKQSMQRPVAATPSVGRWGRNRFARQLEANRLCMDRLAGKLHRLAFFCHCEELATKQSIRRPFAASPSVGRWAETDWPGDPPLRDSAWIAAPVNDTGSR